MKRIFQIILGLVAIAAGLTGAWYGRSTYLENVITVQLPVPLQDIEPYTILTPEMLAWRDFPRALIAEQGDYATQPDELTGKITTSILAAGLPIPARLVATPSEFRLAEAELEVFSLPVTPEVAVGGQIQIGDQVNIYRLTAWEEPVVDKETYESTRGGVFFGGDAAFGPLNIIWAVEHGHQAAISIHRHCQGESLRDRLPVQLQMDSRKMGLHEWSYSNDFDPAERRLTVHLSTQAPHMMKNIFARHLPVEEDAVRVVCRDVGGSLGTEEFATADRRQLPQSHPPTAAQRDLSDRLPPAPRPPRAQHRWSAARKREPEPRRLPGSRQYVAPPNQLRLSPMLVS